MFRNAIFVVVLVVIPGAALAASPDICTRPSVMTLSGKVRELQSFREEPQAYMETWFWLDLPAPLCGKTSVNAAMIGTIPCREGDQIALTGTFTPPSPMFDTAKIRVTPGSVSCTAAR